MDQAARYIKKGMKHRKKGNLEEAIEYYDKALKVDPENATAWSSKARVLDELGEIEEAMKCYKRSLDINPRNASVWNNKGYAFRKKYKYNQAIECYDKALEIQSNYAKAWYNKGYILEKQLKYDEAIACFDKAIEFNPDNEKYRTSRNSVLEKNKNIQKAFDNAASTNEETTGNISRDHSSGSIGDQHDHPIHYYNDQGSDKSDHSDHQQHPQQSKNSGGETRVESDLSNIFVIMEKLKHAIDHSQSLETLSMFESQIEDILNSIKEKKEILERKQEEDTQTCVICLETPPNMICIPCGHMCLCENCKSKLTKKKCPVCNQTVKNIYKVFK